MSQTIAPGMQCFNHLTAYVSDSGVSHNWSDRLNHLFRWVFFPVCSTWDFFCRLALFILPCPNLSAAVSTCVSRRIINDSNLFSSCNVGGDCGLCLCPPFAVRQMSGVKVGWAESINYSLALIFRFSTPIIPAGRNPIQSTRIPRFSFQWVLGKLWWHLEIAVHLNLV